MGQRGLRALALQQFVEVVPVAGRLDGDLAVFRTAINKTDEVLRLVLQPDRLDDLAFVVHAGCDRVPFVIIYSYVHGCTSAGFVPSRQDGH
jgi:hypothetical protein